MDYKGEKFMTRKDIKAFVTKYLDASGKPYEAITEYRHYNQELVEQDKEKIIEFFCNIYDFTKVMSFSDLLTSKDGTRLYELKSIYDLDDFEDVMGLLFASNILLDSLSNRYDIYVSLMPSNKAMLLSRELFDLSNFACEEDYLLCLEKEVLPVNRFIVNESVLEYQEKTQPLVEIDLGYTDDEIRDILTYWFLKFGPARSFINYFQVILNDNLESILNYAAVMGESNEGQQLLLEKLLGHSHTRLLETVNTQCSELSNNDKRMLGKQKKQLLDQLHEEMQQKNRHL